MDNKKIKTDLNIFLFTIITLITIGIVFVYSSSSIYSLERMGIAHYFVKKQIIGLLLGLLGLSAALMFPLHIVKKMTPFVFWFTFFITAGTLIKKISQNIHGSSRWLNLFGFTFQPSEMLKIAFVLYIAYIIAKKENRLSSFIHGYIPIVLIIGITSILLLAQPDFGTTVTLATTAFLLLFIAKFKTSHLLFTLFCMIPTVISLVYLKAYRLKRILTFLNPWQDPKGAGFQIIQSLIAIGSGSFWGVGIANSKQKFFYLPMQHTDFIFSIIAEETGFMGSLIIILLFIAFTYLGMRIAWQLQDRFCIFAILGFIILTTLQAIINLSVTTGLVPTKGIGLPFVSYGNTALVCNLCMIGLIINMVYSNVKK